MDSTLLEQGILLTLGWQKRVAHFKACPDALTSQDKPAGITLSNASFITLQNKLAIESCLWWEQEAKALLQHWKQEQDALLKRQQQLLQAVDQGKLTVAAANKKAQPLAMKSEESGQIIQEIQEALSLFKKPPASLPTLPLCRYSVVNHRATQEYTAQTTAQLKDRPAYLLKFNRLFLTAKKHFQTLSLSDQIALSLAILLSLFIAAGGVFFVLRDEGLQLSWKAHPLGHYEIFVTNKSRKSVSLLLPYDGGTIEKTDNPTYGILVEQLEKGKRIPLDQPLEQLWFFQEKAAYLKGPILLSPLSQEKLQLNIDKELSEEADGQDTGQISLTVYKAPRKKKTAYVFSRALDASESEASLQ